MKKSSLLAYLLGALAIFPASAELVTPEAALSRALNSVPTRSASAEFKLRSTINAESGAAVYLFSDGKSSLAVSADSQTPALLGYFDSDQSASHSPAFNYWIDQYAAQIEWLRKNPRTYTVTRATEETRQPVGPLVTTKWNQDAPYNDMCPEINGKRSVTGCVATSMAQALYYYKWPVKGKGTNSYKLDKDDPNSTTITFSYGTTTFDWANMTDIYNDQSTEEQKKAVATLMFACGVSVEMHYTPRESGAVAEFVPEALIRNFDYDKGTRLYVRDYYTQDEWNEIVYRQLHDNGPVIYNGQSDEGGHSFICDGYNDGYFHINWGWGGLDDGFFLLSVLDPGDMEGIGGSSGAFSYDQTIIGDMKKPREGSTVPQIIAMMTPFDLPATSSRVATINVKSEVTTYSSYPVSGELGVILEEENGDRTPVKGTAYQRFETLYYFESYHFTLPSNLKQGVKYTVYPAYCPTGGEWTIMPVKKGMVSKYTMVVGPETVTFTAEKVAEATILDPVFTTPIFADKYVTVKGMLENPTEIDYIGTAQLMCVDTAENAVSKHVGIRMPIEVKAGEKKEFIYTSTLDISDEDGNFKSGEYTFVFFNPQLSTQLSDVFKAEVKIAPATDFEVTEFSIQGNPENVDKDNMVFNIKVICNQGYLADPLLVVIANADKLSVDMFESEPVYVEAGKEAEVTVKGKFRGGQPDTKYMAAVFYDNGKEGVQKSDPIGFKLGTAGVKELTDDDNVASMQVFSTSGALILESRNGKADLSTLSSGIYIIRAVTTEGEVKSKRILVNQL